MIHPIHRHPAQAERLGCFDPAELYPDGEAYVSIEEAQITHGAR